MNGRYELNMVMILVKNQIDKIFNEIGELTAKGTPMEDDKLRQMDKLTAQFDILNELWVTLYTRWATMQ